jgi:hypothetical protein
MEAQRRFEFAARALAGRLPRPITYRLVEADDTTVDTVLAQLAERTAEEDLIVIDDTRGARLAGPVQCIDTTRELLYFHRPSQDLRPDLHRRHSIAA